MFDFKFDWDSRLELDIPHIDSQHQQLFKIGRRIEQYLIFQCAGTTHEDLLHILYELRDYITYHFFTEEKYMIEIGFPDFNEHIKQHQEFKTYINTIDYEKLCSAPTESLHALKDYLVKWIFQHMVHEDQKIAEFIKKTP